MSLNREDYDFELDDSSIARYPRADRSAARLLQINRQTHVSAHRHIRDLPNLLSEQDVLVFNQTQVVPARLWLCKPTGGKVEMLFESITPEGLWLAHLGGKRLKIGMKLHLQQDDILWENAFCIRGCAGRLFLLERLAGAPEGDWLALLAQVGQMPIPPYFKREAIPEDALYYQSVFAQENASASSAAPTAGLHFDQPLLDSLEASGVQCLWIDHQIGAGTFEPIRTTDIQAHQMHGETSTMSEATAEALNQARTQGKRIIAVGSTAVRNLESHADEAGHFQAASFSTDLFIYPGYRFRAVDSIITNFHLPKSTLLCLVSAFYGRERILEAYQFARDSGYQFFSYGDAMWLV